MCKDKTKGFNLLFLVPPYGSSHQTLYFSVPGEPVYRLVHVQTNRSLVSWMGEGKRAFKAGFRQRRNLESLERL